MTNGEELKKDIKESGLSIVYIANKLNCSRNRVYAIINGADCTAAEITTLSELLRMTRDRRDYIFLAASVN